MIIGIYKITAPNGKIYIGQSKDIDGRIKHYKSRTSLKGQRKLVESFRAYGVLNHQFELVIECEVLQLNNQERHYQNFYNCIGENGLNDFLTRSDTELPTCTKEVRQKMSASRIGRIPWNKGAKGKQVAWNKGKEWDEVNKHRLRTMSLGKKLTDEHKLKISMALTGIPKSKEHGIKVGLAQRGKIVSLETREKQRISRINYYLKTKTQ